MTPYNSVDGEGWLPSLDSLLAPLFDGICLEGAYGQSTHNYRDDSIKWSATSMHDPIPRFDRKGWSIHMAVGLPKALRQQLAAAHLGWLAESCAPLISWGKAWDRTVRSVKMPGTGEFTKSNESPEEEYSGWELTVANLFTLRRGQVDNPRDMLHGTTSGWGIGFNLRDLGGLRYDHATVPQALELESVDRSSLTIFVNPLAV